MKLLNLGCGTDIKKGWVNLDCVELPGVDVCHDLEKFPYPFPNDYFDLILARHVLEHLDRFVDAIRELHRILKPGGVLRVIVPHFSSKDAFSDPTHKRCFSVNTFDYFVKGHSRNYYFDFQFSYIKKKRIRFQKRVAYPYNYVLEYLVNANRHLQNLYEGSPLRVFPAYEVEVEIVK